MAVPFCDTWPGSITVLGRYHPVVLRRPADQRWAPAGIVPGLPSPALVLAVGLLAALCLAGTAHAAFPGENGKVAFVSYRDGNWEIYTMNDDGSEQTNVTKSVVEDLHPAFSPDGQRIAFTSNCEGLATCSFVNFEIYTIAPDGSGVARLTNESAFDGDPDWQPLARSPAPPAAGAARRPASPPAPRPPIGSALGGLHERAAGHRGS